MNISYKTEAIVLKSKDVKETDRFYTIFSKEKGKMRIAAKGVRKPMAKLAGGLEPITRSEIFLVSGRQFDRVTGVIVHEYYSDIKQDLFKIGECRRLFEIVDSLAPEREPNEEVYEWISFFLSQSEKFKDENTLPLRLLQLGTVWRIIVWSGYQPALFHCANCKKKLVEKEHYWFSAPHGVLCPECEHNSRGRKIRIDKDTIKILRIFVSGTLPVLLKIKAGPDISRKLKQVTTLMLEEVLGKRIIL